MPLTRKEFLDLVARTGMGAAALPSVVRQSDGTAAQSAAPAAHTSRRGREPTKGTTADVVRFIESASIASFPADVVRQGKRCLIDGFGVILAGATVRGSSIVRNYVKAIGGRPEATVFGPEPLKGPVELAALANGASGHAMDYDDTQLSTTPDRTFGLLTHPTVPALASALALSERLGVSGRQFLEAFLVGFEVECKISEAIDPDHYNRGFHSTGTVGTFAGAAAAAKLLKQPAPAIAHAVAIAASLSAGIRVNFGSMTKPFHAGRAAQNGLVAATLASDGFTGGADGLDGEWGFFQVCGGGADQSRIAGVLGRPFTIVSPGVSVKPYPCGSLSHPSMDAMLKLVVDHDIRPETVQSIRVRAGSNILNPLRYKTAKTELEAKFCLPFLMTAIVLRRNAGIREFTDEFVSSEPVQRMMAQVETQFDAEIEAKGFDKMRSIVEVRLRDGRSWTQPSDDRYRGGPERPFTQAELHQKFADCAQLVLPNERIAQALELIERVDQLENVRELVAALTPGATRQVARAHDRAVAGRGLS
jgi:2-methylcitrate dehydratase PrpD